MVGRTGRTSKGRAGALCHPLPEVVLSGRKRSFTFRDANDDQTDEATQYQENSLGFLPPEPLQHEDTTNTGGDFHCSKGKLCQVDVQTKVCHIQAQPVVDKAVHKPESQAGWH